ncbi:hypothetical protein GCM10009751_09320 [Myceligenerans crystallogenes]|uniref:Tat (Twin-arginine translocation) pathway signal sequence n=1 Tax=Myceligenerans crystallogenes TaxID=316335 RepID=A0ABP4ZF90_9MICO
MTHFGKTTLTYAEQGKRRITPELVAAYERHLGTGILDPIANLEHVGRGDVDRRSFIRTAAYTAGLGALALAGGDDLARLAAHTDTSATGATTIEALRRMTDSMIAVDETLGGGVGRTAVAEFLATDVAAVLRGRFISEQVRADAFSAAAEVAYLAGWKAHDAGLDGLAQRYYLSALDLTRESGDAGHEAFVLRILALQGCDVGQKTYSVRLAEASRDRARQARLDPDTEALFYLVVARCQAETGEHAAAARTIARAPSLNAEVSEQFPRWAAQWGPHKGPVLRQSSKTFTAMNDTAEAASFLTEVTGIWDPAGNARIWALSMAELGHAQWRNADPAAATSTWNTALPVLDQISSDRTRKQAAKIRHTLRTA